MRIFLPALCAVALLAGAANSADVPHKLTGAYATIDVRRENETIQSLQRANAQQRADLIKKITEHPENYAPPVLFLISSLLFEGGQKEAAVFWFYAAQVRGLIDANICADPSAQGVIVALNGQFGPPINRYAFRDIARLTNTVARVLTWEERTGCHYDRRWINLQGQGALGASTNAPLSAPQTEWESIRKKTRDDYRAAFNEGIKALAQKGR